MKRFLVKIFIYSSFFAILFSCTDSSFKKKTAANERAINLPKNIKPPSSFTDTLQIADRSAVFYFPDSLQLEKIKAVTDSSVFDGSMHEYYYQLRNAHIILKKDWGDVKITEAKNVRYLKFIKADKSFKIIDLDSSYDTYGLFVFDTIKDPVLLELTNVESELGFYFSEKKDSNQE